MGWVSTVSKEQLLEIDQKMNDIEYILICKNDSLNLQEIQFIQTNLNEVENILVHLQQDHMLIPLTYDLLSQLQIINAYFIKRFLI
ncbi:hypothetical protein ACT7C7_30045 [Bacillus cereus]